jgi:predicted nuclease of predicted toxin-antitoxin system
MKFKIDENLPVEIADLLRSDHYDAMTVMDQELVGAKDQFIAEVCLQEGRILITLDLDFADIYTYPLHKYPGFIVFRVHRQEKYYLINIFQRMIPLISHNFQKHQLWIIEDNRIRIREG